MTALAMPAPDEDVLSRRQDILKALKSIVPGEGVVHEEREMRA